MSLILIALWVLQYLLASPNFILIPAPQEHCQLLTYIVLSLMNFVELSFSTQYVVNVFGRWPNNLIVIVPRVYTGRLFAKDQGRCVTKLKFLKFSLFV